MADGSLLVALYGPTSSGKTKLSVDVAERLRKSPLGEAVIISADSRQVYRYLDIGTSKTTPAEMRGVPHEMISVADPVRKFELEDYLRQARQHIQDAFVGHALPALRKRAAADGITDAGVDLRKRDFAWVNRSVVIGPLMSPCGQYDRAKHIDLGLGAKLLLALGAYAHVGVAAQMALLHVARGDLGWGQKRQRSQVGNSRLDNHLVGTLSESEVDQVSAALLRDEDVGRL